MTKMEVIELSKFQKTPIGRSGFWGRQSTQPFVIAFVYSDKGNFVVKGMEKAVVKHIANHFPNSIYNMTYWKKGTNFNSWQSPRAIYIFLKEVNGKHRQVISIFSNKKLVQEIVVRRVPHKWLDAYAQADFKTER